MARGSDVSSQRLRIPFSVAVACAVLRKGAKRMLGRSGVFSLVFRPLSGWTFRSRLPGGMEVALRPFSNDPWIAREVALARVYERRGSLPRGGTVIDVGAHIGIFTILASRAAGPDGRVLAFEPAPDNFELLLENLRRNGCENVEAQRRAVSSVKGARQFRVSRAGATGSNTLEVGDKSAGQPGESETIYVDCLTLDSLVQEGALPSLDFLKVDVEGHELEVLRGGAGVLERLRPRIVVETNPRSPRRESVTSFLEARGYEVRGGDGYAWILFADPAAP